MTPIPRPCSASTNARRSSGVPRVACGRVVARHLVAPRRAERVLHHRHQLHVREPELLHVVAELVGEVAPPEALPPRARMHLVGGHRRAERIRSAPPRQPVVVRPRVARAVDDRRGGGRLLGAERERIRLETRDAVRAVDGELVGMPLARMRGDARPDPRRLLRLEDVDTLAPGVPVADHRDRTRVRRPDREAHAGVLGVERMRAEALPQPLVTPLAEEVEIELPEHARAAHVTGSSRRSMPTIGIVAHSGRLRVSYRSS